MKKTQYFISILVLFFSVHLHVNAQSCSVDSAVIGAKYQVSVTNNEGEMASYPVNIWRHKNKVVYEYPHKQKAEYWYIANKQKSVSVQLTRYYDGFERGIEYQLSHKTVKANIRKWNKLNSVIALSDFELSSSKTSAFTCDETMKIVSKQGVDIEWLNYYQLPKHFKLTQKGKVKSWQLRSLITDAKVVQSKVNSRNHYQVTDYADIGDNESDEFLSKMIVMGF
ncbi:hypothetical protein JQC92_09865 [Shewanella sp. 202IG2-18]|uniref:hypothetical protein n=1 Tax=Parashewanella hymeniacidonis TaxID=2807618 RepID=UPI00195FDCC8|nr:hypothetical protein [Parashewanella hymeniacidonis]MBM7072334.1 hypothetical protein [Parashewanella hymeniacidonis]